MGEVPAKWRWAVLAAIYLCGVTYGVTLQSIPPLLHLIMAELNATYAEAGLLMSLFSLPGIFLAVPAGILADRYGPKVIVIVSGVLILGGLALMWAGATLGTLIAGRVISGTGAATLIVVLPSTLARWFAGRELGTALGVLNTGMPIGTILAFSLLAGLGESHGWRFAILASMVALLAATVAFGVLYRPPPGGAPSGAARPDLWKSASGAGSKIWLVSAAWLLFNAATISFYTFTPEFFVKSGFSPVEAGVYAGAAMWPAIVVSPAVGILMDRYGRKRTLAITGALVMAGLFLLVPASAGWTLGLMLLIGLFQTMGPSPIMALIPEVVPPEKIGFAFGVNSMFLNVGILVGPALVGFVRDATGSCLPAYAVMSGFALLMVFFIAALRLRPRPTS